MHKHQSAGELKEMSTDHKECMSTAHRTCGAPCHIRASTEYMDSKNTKYIIIAGLLRSLVWRWLVQHLVRPRSRYSDRTCKRGIHTHFGHLLNVNRENRMVPVTFSGQMSSSCSTCSHGRYTDTYRYVSMYHSSLAKFNG